MRVKLLRWWGAAQIAVRGLRRRGQVESELDRELRFHLQQLAAEHRARGLSPAVAHQAALREIGGVTKIEEECRDMRSTHYIENLLQDLAYTVRTLAKAPTFALIMIATLALAIGANSAIFSVIEGVLLRPLPYPQPDRLVRVFVHSAQFEKFPLNPFDFRDFRARNRSFQGLAAYTRSDLQLSGAADPVKLRGFRVTSGYFQVLGLHPARGREFNFNEELPGNGRSAILSDRAWRQQFSASPDILGRTILLNSEPFTVVGVMPPGVEHPGNLYNPVPYGETVDVWTPFTFQGNPAQRGSHYLEVIGRLQTAVAPSQAQAELNTVLAEIKRQYSSARGWTVLLNSIYQEIVGPSRRLLLVLLGAVGLVLLIACVNAANLLLARATVRQREIALRSALGAGRGRLVRQMLVESLLIALIGAVCGAALALGGTRVLVNMLPAGFARASEIHVNATVFAFNFAIAVITGLLFGVAPAWQACRTDLQQSLRDGGRASTSGVRHLRFRNALVMGEVGLACVLLIGAGLMLRSFVNLLRSDPGFQPQHVLTAVVSLPRESYQTNTAIVGFYDRLLADLSTLPEVQSAGAGTDVPWTGYDDNAGFNIEGRPAAPNDGPHARYHAASRDYFQAVGIPLTGGRLFSPRDSLKAPSVLIVNASMAKRYWPNQSALGKRIAFADKPQEKDWFTIVGVVGDVKDRPEKSTAEPAFWWPLSQQPFSSTAIVLRSHTGAAALANQLRATVRRLDPSLAVGDVRQLDEIAVDSFSQPRFALFLVGLFATLALTLAMTGMYGVISYSVNQRIHEFGVRMALGAGSWGVIRLVVAQGLKLAVAGVIFGLLAALAFGRILASLLYEVSGADPLTFTGVAVLALAAAGLACYLPARRATTADPMLALRSE